MDSSDENDIAERTWKRASEPVFKEAFREGADAGKKESLQNGFNVGYSAGYKVAYNSGLKQGALNAMMRIDSLKQLAENYQQVVDGHKGNCQMCPTVSTGSVKLDTALAWENVKDDQTLDYFKVQQDLANATIFEDTLLNWIKRLD